MAAICSPTQRFLRSFGGHALLIGISALFCLPFVWLVLTSLKPADQIFEFPPTWIPREFKWSNYRDALNYVPLIRYTFNTLFIAVSATFGTLLSCSLVAYGFGVVRWRYANVFFVIMLATVMLPPQVTMLPVFMIFKELGWIGTFLPLVVPSFFGAAFSIFLLRQFFKGIPLDLVDAARLDGCSHFECYWRVVLPLAKPALTVVAFFTFTGHWNDFMGPLIYLNDDSRYTLSLGLQQFVVQHVAKWDLFMAASTMMILPVIALFFFLQKTFIEGINLTGLNR